jgi:hypothetical protein
VLDGHETLHLLEITGHRGIDAPSRVAGRMPLHRRSPQRVLPVVRTAARSLSRALGNATPPGPPGARPQVTVTGRR